MRLVLLLLLLIAGIAWAADPPKITPEMQAEYASAVDAAQLAQAEAEVAVTRLAALRAVRAMNAVVTRMAAICPLELDSTGKPQCKAETPKKP